MRVRSGLYLPLAIAAVGVATLIGCAKKTTPTTNPVDKPPGEGTSTASVDNPNPDVGERLYKPAEPPAFPPLPPAGTEPIVINCYAQFEERQQVAAEVDSKIELIASPLTLRNGQYEWKQPDGTVVVYDPAHPHPGIVFHPRDMELFPNDRSKWVPYWKLSESDTVTSGQILCLLDDQLVTTKMNAADKVKKASNQMMDAAERGLKLSEDKIKLYKDKPGAASAIALSQILDDQIMVARFAENLGRALQTIAKADQDYDEARVMLRKYQITSRVDGIIRSVAKRPGEFARGGDKIFEIQSTEKVRLEGNMDVQYFNNVKRNMIVRVEPAVPSAPVASHPTGHRQEITGVAVTGHADRPLIVSASLDGSALVWDPNLDRKDRPGLSHNLPHPVAVRCVACTPPGAKAMLAVTGADDGKVRIWDLSNPEKLPKTPKYESTDAHGSGVTAITISPDGKYAATAAGREVFIWDLAEGKKLYALPLEHRDSITALSFTPQCQLVTAAKDHTLKVWKLGTEKAAVTRTIDHRSGVVDTLGVSPDGGRMLFDQDKNRIDLVNLSDAQTTGQLTNAGPSVAFATLALFAPDYSTPDKPLPYTIVTAGGEGELKGGLQVWQVPQAGGRAGEIARLITPGRAGVTCAAFSPHKDARFLVVGTDRGTIHVWTPPSEAAKQLEGRITNIDATDPRYVTVRVEMNNPKDAPMLDHSAATVIINPAQK